MPLPREVLGERRILNQHARLDVSVLAALREVGAGDEGLQAVDGHSLGVQPAIRGAGARGADVVVEAWVRRAEGPVCADELGQLGRGVRFGAGGHVLGLLDVDEEGGVHAVLERHAVEGLEHITRVVEAVAGQNDAPRCRWCRC